MEKKLRVTKEDGGVQKISGVLGEDKVEKNPNQTAAEKSRGKKKRI